VALRNFGRKEGKKGDEERRKERRKKERRMTGSCRKHLKRVELVIV